MIITTKDGERLALPSEEKSRLIDDADGVAAIDHHTWIRVINPTRNLLTYLRSSEVILVEFEDGEV